MKGVSLMEGRVCIDHMHMYLAIPPQMSISEFMSYRKGKHALSFFDRHPELRVKTSDICGRGYYVVTVGNVNEETIINYIRNQEENNRLEDGIK
jgi:putative transposase